MSVIMTQYEKSYEDYCEQRVTQTQRWERPILFCNYIDIWIGSEMMSRITSSVEERLWQSRGGWDFVGWSDRRYRDTREEPCEDRHTGRIDRMQTHRPGGHAEVEAEAGVVQLQAGASRITRSDQKREGSKIGLLSWSLQGQHGPPSALILDFWAQNARG